MNFEPMNEFLDFLISKGLPGYDVTIRQGYHEVYRRRAGYSDLATQKPVDGSELYQLCSVTKIFTCVTALKLYEKGIYTMDEPVAKYLPEFASVTVRDRGTRPPRTTLEIGDLFSMSSGISYGNAREIARETYGSDPTTRQMASCIARVPLEFDPHTRWMYGASHDVLGALIEVWSGRRFYDQMKETVLEPLGCRETAFFPAHPEKIATAYQYNEAEQRIELSLRKMGFGNNYESGGGGLLAPVDDCARLMEMLANGGVAANGNRILSRGTIDMMRTNTLDEARMRDFNWPRMRGYGYGYGVRTLISRAAGSNGPVGEFGWAGAAGAFALADPENQLSLYYAEHVFNPQEDFLHTRLRNVLYACL